jgi:hypothetical protein
MTIDAYEWYAEIHGNLRVSQVAEAKQAYAQVLS